MTQFWAGPNPQTVVSWARTSPAAIEINPVRPASTGNTPRLPTNAPSLNAISRRGVFAILHEPQKTPISAELSHMTRVHPQWA